MRLMNQPITVNDSDSRDPVCPYCEQEIHSVSVRKMESMLGVRYLYYCSNCQKTLGISHRKGFWMG